MRVDFGGAKAGVAEEVLDDAEVGAAFQQVGSDWSGLGSRERNFDAGESPAVGSERMNL